MEDIFDDFFDISDPVSSHYIYDIMVYFFPIFGVGELDENLFLM